MENQAEHKDEDGMDKISELPQPILHHILSLLSQKDAVRTCVLSKPWRYLGSTRPIVDLRESCSGHIFPDNRCFCKTCFQGNKEAFLVALDKTLQRYHDQNLSIHEFRLDLSRVDSRSISLLDKWIPTLIVPNLKKNLNTFHLSLRFPNRSEYFDLPSTLFKAEFLQILDLRECKFSSTDDVLLKGLRTLTLHDVHVSKETLEAIFSSSPLLENVSLFLCKGFKTIKLMNKPHGLKAFVINNMPGCRKKQDNPVKVVIDIPTIESIRVIDCWFNHRHYLPHLTSLFLNGARLSILSTIYLSGKFLPCLEHLTLDSCYLPQEFHLHLSASVKRLGFKNIMNSKNASIDAPNIAQFWYESEISQSTIPFTTTSGQWKLDITVHLDSDASLWFHKLSEKLEAFSRSEISLQLVQQKRGRNDWRHIVDDDPSSLFRLVERHGPVVEIEHLNLMGDYEFSSLPDFLNCLFRFCRPRYIDQKLNFGNDVTKGTELTEFLMEMFLLVERDMRPYSWPQDLEQVSIVEALDENAPRNGVKVCFQMEWRERES